MSTVQTGSIAGSCPFFARWRLGLTGLSLMVVFLSTLLAPALSVCAQGVPEASNPEIIGSYCPNCKGYYGMDHACFRTGSSSSSSGHKSSSEHKETLKQAVVEAFGEALNDALKAKAAREAKEAQLYKKQAAAQALKIKQEEAARKAAGVQSWNNVRQSEAQAKAGDVLAGQAVLDRMMGAGGGGAAGTTHTDFFGTRANPGIGIMSADFLPMPSGVVPTPAGALGQLENAAGFSQAAVKADSMAEARMLAGQAEIVMNVRSTALQAPPPTKEPVPEVSKCVIVDSSAAKEPDMVMADLLAKQSKADKGNREIEGLKGQYDRLSEQANALRASDTPEDKAEAHALAKEAERLAKLIKHKEKEAERLAKELKDQMTRLGGGKQDNTAP